MERERIERQKHELLRLEREHQRMEREKLEREREELRRQQMRCVPLALLDALFAVAWLDSGGGREGGHGRLGC